MIRMKIKNYNVGGGKEFYIAPSMRVVSLENENSILAASSPSTIQDWFDGGNDSPDI